MGSQQKRHPRIRVGDQVRFTFGVRQTVGTIVEDRGPIGNGGQRLFAIRVPITESDPMTIELQADEIEVVKRRAA